MGEVKYEVELPPFTGRNVPISEIARATGKEAQYIRVGLQRGILKFGHAIKMKDSSEYSYFCPDKKVWEETGYFRYEPNTEAGWWISPCKSSGVDQRIVVKSWASARQDTQ